MTQYGIHLGPCGPVSGPDHMTERPIEFHNYREVFLQAEHVLPYVGLLCSD